MKRVVLITGGTGFIGSNLAKAYLKKNAEVHLITRKKSNLAQIKEVQNNLHLHNYDGDFNSLDLAMRNIKPDIVFHLASLTSTDHHSEEIEELIQSNIIFGTLLLEAMIKNDIKHLVNVGSFWQNYNNEEYNPVNLYAATKEAFEKILKYYNEVHGLQSVTLKLFDTYGPNDPRPKIFSLLNELDSAGEYLNLTKGEQLIDLVYIDDVLEAFMVVADDLLENSLSFGTYSVSSGNPLQLKEVVELYLRLMNIERSDLINWGGRPYKKREVMIPWNRGEVLPNWQPRVTLTEGIMAMKKT